MKHAHRIALVPALLLGILALAVPSSATAVPHADPQVVVEERVGQLEKDLTLANARLIALSKDLESTRAALDQTLAYLAVQSKSAQAMVEVLAEAERQGFAVGENFRSRQILLEGWRAQLDAQSQGLPKGAGAAAPAAPTVNKQRGRVRPSTGIGTSAD